MAGVQLGTRERSDLARIVELLRQVDLSSPEAAKADPELQEAVRVATSLDPELREMLARGQLPKGYHELVNDDLARLLGDRLSEVPFGTGSLLGDLGGPSFSTLARGSFSATRTDTTPATPQEIRKAERWLKQLGYDPGTIDTQLTPKSRQALAEFQAAVGLNGEQAGEPTDRTLKRLESTVKRIHAQNSSYLTPGMKSDKVKRLQQRLARLGDFQGTPDGIYGQTTADAVQSFRKRHPSLNNNIRSWGGKADKALSSELKNIAHDPYRRRVTPSTTRRNRDRRMARAFQNGQRIGPNSPRALIGYMQDHLKAAGYDPNHGKEGDRSWGKWTPHTQAMLNQFQRRSGLGETQQLGPNTWRKLKHATMETRSAFSPTQRIGERSAAVKRTERRLKKAGYNPGKIDGMYTKATERAADRLRAHFHIHGRNGVGSATNRLISKRIKEKSDAAIIARIPFYHELAPKLQEAAKWAVRHGLTITSTTHGTHAPGSYHYPASNPDGKGHAIDVAIPGSARFEPKIAAFVRHFAGQHPRELFYDHLSGFPSPSHDHFDHAHLALF